MGRGRAKAKQTKVARELKYGGPKTDLDRLQAELAGSPHHEHPEVDEAVEIEVDEPVEDPYASDPYAKYYDDEDSDDEDSDDGNRAASR